MSLPEQERRALREAWEFLLRVSGDKSIGPKALRQEARAIVKHFPLGGEVDAQRWAGEEKP